jgi:hypothetical protein
MNTTICPECLSTQVTTPDKEGLIDCLECGIFFDPTHPNNQTDSPYFGQHIEPDAETTPRYLVYAGRYLPESDFEYWEWRWFGPDLAAALCFLQEVQHRSYDFCGLEAALST